MDIDLKLAERVMRAIADAGFARRSQLEMHSTLTGDLGLIGHGPRFDIANALVTRFPVCLPWTEVSEWQTVAEVVRSVQAGFVAEAAR